MALTLGLVLSAPAHAAVPVPSDYYGVGFQRMAKLGPAAQDTHLAQIAALGINQVRFNASWAAIEPVAPKGGVHSYRWGAMDQQIGAMAQHGIRGQPTLTQPPDWNAVQGYWVDFQCAKASSRAPVRIDPYARFVKAFAQRYGRYGSFWVSHPGLPKLPVRRFEIWNEANLKGGWCPRPQPWLYADLFVAAAQAIRSVDPGARVMTGGVAPPAKPNKAYLAIADFLGRATARRPNLTQHMSEAAVHIYPSTDAQKQLERLAWFREQLRKGRIPDRIPMIVNEIGWATHVGKTPLTEADRAAAYTRMTVNYARTNCNVGGVIPHTWISPQQRNHPEDWFGIANPSTAAPYDSARAFAYAVKLMRGQLSTPPPTQTHRVC